jgi:hypothetical protein
MPINPQDLLDALSHYRLTHACFSRFITWFCGNIPEAVHDQYDLISLLIENDPVRLQQIEEILSRSMEILDLQENEFIKAFGFKDDLLASDPEKIHDVLAEPLVVINLDDLGFSKIRKIRKSIRKNGVQIPTADFLAEHQNDTFAIEIKTVRMEQNIKPGQFMGDPFKPFWWGEMLQNNLITKIEDKERRVIDQLINTAAYFNCDKKMLVLYTRRLGPSTLLSDTEVEQVLENLAWAYPEIDTWCVKSFFNEVYFYPSLGND